MLKKSDSRRPCIWWLTWYARSKKSQRFPWDIENRSSFHSLLSLWRLWIPHPRLDKTTRFGRSTLSVAELEHHSEDGEYVVSFLRKVSDSITVFLGPFWSTRLDLANWLLKTIISTEIQHKCWQYVHCKRKFYDENTIKIWAHCIICK